MRRWTVRAALSVACTTPALRPRLTVATCIRSLSTAEDSALKRHQLGLPHLRRYPIFDKVGLPEPRSDAWAALLDGALPPHLRDWSNNASPPTLSAVDVAEILLEAQHPRDPATEPIDLLYHLGINQGRWTAVVWLVKKLVEKFPARHSQNGRLSKINAVWDQVLSLENDTRSPLELPPITGTATPSTLELRGLNDLTDGVAENTSIEEVFAHDALGQIWRTLGAMTKSCTGAEIRPEVLEIIAFLHHQEIMPMSIYHSERHPDSSAIQQPPMLSLLSSRILTSLSDAAWRAHEKLVVEEAKARGGEYAALRPEIPGTAYRVHVAGLRPEVWMELILWSCLRGGWIIPGADILRSITQDPEWKPLSWQDYERAMPEEHRSHSTAWSDWEFVFKTRGPSTRDAPKGKPERVVRTVSAELVNAYVDALAGIVSVGVGKRGVDIENIIERLHELKNFLRGRRNRLTLSTGSWDALIIRLIESQTIIPEEDPAIIRNLVALSPGFSQGLGNDNTQNLPDYVLDGNMALHGLLHLALRGQIAAGSFEGALEEFNHLQNRTDLSRRKSIEDFLGAIRQSSSPRTRARSSVLASNDMFTDNFSGIEHPELQLQIPTPTLAALLDLATDAKAYEFGSYLLHRDDIDGPVIGPHMYQDPHIQPAVIRFAEASGDETLFSQLKHLNLAKRSLRVMLSIQFRASKWNAALRILQHLQEISGLRWNAGNLAVLIQKMLTLHSASLAGDEEAKEDLNTAKNIFTNMIKGGYGTLIDAQASQMRNLVAVLLAADPSWAELCDPVLRMRGQQKFELPTHVFNGVLKSIIEVYGSATGRRALELFWPAAIRHAHDAAVRLSRGLADRGRMAKLRPSPLDSVSRRRVVVELPGSRELVIRGVLLPNTETIMIILKHALEEIGDVEGSGQGSSDTTAEIAGETSDIVKWAVRRLAELPYVEASIIEQLREVLRSKGLASVVYALPAIAQIVRDDLLADGERLTQTMSATGEEEKESDMHAMSSESERHTLDAAEEEGDALSYLEHSRSTTVY